MKRLPLTTVLFASLSAVAADGAKSPSAEKYDIDASHSGIIFGWNHFGFSNPNARSDKIEGSVQLDKGHAAFVPAGAEHSFSGYEQLAVLVIFAKRQ